MGWLGKVVQVLLPVGILAVGVGVFVALAASKEPPKKVERALPVPPVEVEPVTDAPSGGFRIRVNGTVVPKREIRLAAEVEGRIVEKTDLCWAGRSVRRGDVLLRIDRRPLELQERTLESEMAKIEADLEQLEVEIQSNAELLALAEEDVELQKREQGRFAQLSRRNAASTSELEQANRLVLTARQQLQSLINESNTFDSRRNRLAAERRNAEARLEQVRYDLQRTVIAAPVDGRIVEELVEADAFVRPGEALVSIEDSSTMEVRCSLRMEELYWLSNSVPVPILTADSSEGAIVEDPYQIPRARALVSFSLAGESVEWEGVLARYEGSGIDERTRTVPCRIEIPSSEDGSLGGLMRLRRGMFVSVTLHAEAPRVPMLSIPRMALRPNSEIWLVQDGALRILGVQTVRPLEDRILIRADTPGLNLSPGDPLVISPLPAPIDGMEVRILGTWQRPASAVSRPVEGAAEVRSVGFDGKAGDGITTETQRTQ
ncbi:hypothetical protein BH23PLA1_BH23PLA1_05100 [soil metagenome]